MKFDGASPRLGCKLTQINSFQFLFKSSPVSARWKVVPMKDRRFSSILLLVLFVFETTLINLGSASCSDHSKPSGESWANNWDGLVDFDCGKGEENKTCHKI